MTDLGEPAESIADGAYKRTAQCDWCLFLLAEPMLILRNNAFLSLPISTVKDSFLAITLR